MRQLEFRDADRELSLTLYYPAAPADDADLFTMPFYTGVALHRDAPLLDPQAKRPLVMFSHGRGSNALTYAWFGQYLAARGLSSPLDHYRANSYDATIAYLANKLWQRPKDLSLAITFLLQHPDSGPTVDRERIGVAGHSQGGFTAMGGRCHGERRQIPGFSSQPEGQPDGAGPFAARPAARSRPALDVHDQRIKAAFAMAPIIQAFGMDELGLSRMAIPAFSSSAPATPRRRRGRTPVAATFPAPRSRSCPVWSITRFSSMSATMRAAMNFPKPARCRGRRSGALHRTIGEAAVRFFGTALK